MAHLASPRMGVGSPAADPALGPPPPEVGDALRVDWTESLTHVRGRRDGGGGADSHVTKRDRTLEGGGEVSYKAENNKKK